MPTSNYANAEAKQNAVYTTKSSGGFIEAGSGGLSLLGNGSNPGVKKVSDKGGTSVDAAGRVKATYTFESLSEPTTGKSRGASTSGAISADGDDVPSAYKIKISSQEMAHTVVAILQEEISMRITSEWESFIPMGGVGGVVNQLSQLIGQASLSTRFTSRRIWKGTSPVEIMLSLRFEATEDSYRNVVQPCEKLMMMAAPSTLPGSIPLLVPPGPSPFSISDIPIIQGVLEFAGIQGLESRLGKGDNITIRIGDFLEFNSVIIKEVNPIFDSRMSQSGLPISAKVAVIFQTYEILTKETIESGVFVNKAG